MYFNRGRFFLPPLKKNYRQDIAPEKPQRAFLNGFQLFFRRVLLCRQRLAVVLRKAVRDGYAFQHRLDVPAGRAVAEAGDTPNEAAAGHARRRNDPIHLPEQAGVGFLQTR